MKGLPFMIAAIATLLTVSACGSHTSHQATRQAATSTSEPTLKEQAERYLAIIKPVNEASARFAEETVGRHVVTRREWDSIAKPFLAATKDLGLPPAKPFNRSGTHL